MTAEWSTQQEHRAPWTELLVPAGLLAARGIGADEVLAANQGALVTGFDLHRTLLRVLAPERMPSPPWAFDLLSERVPRGTSSQNRQNRAVVLVHVLQHAHVRLHTVVGLCKITYTTTVSKPTPPLGGCGYLGGYPPRMVPGMLKQRDSMSSLMAHCRRKGALLTFALSPCSFRPHMPRGIRTARLLPVHQRSSDVRAVRHGGGGGQPICPKLRHLQLCERAAAGVLPG